MGMFDYIHYKGYNLQTKSLCNQLESFIIQGDYLFRITDPYDINIYPFTGELEIYDESRWTQFECLNGKLTHTPYENYGGKEF